MSPADLDELIAALDLPAGSRVDQRVPKKLLLEHGAPTASDRRHINEGIEELLWLAALKPTTIGVPEFRDETREYLEIAVLRLTLRPEAKAARLLELVHRAVPYPLLLLAESASALSLSAAHKRWAQNEAAKTVLDGDPVAAEWEAGPAPGYWTAFRDALALGRQPRATLHALYQGWADALLAFRAAQVTGRYRPADSPEQAATRHEALKECARLDAEIAGLRAAATKERQIARQVELNLELKRVESRLAAARQRL
jgi:hypothetical protein